MTLNTTYVNWIKVTDTAKPLVHLLYKFRSPRQKYTALTLRLARGKEKFHVPNTVYTN